MVKNIWSLARLVVVDGLRRYALLGLILFAVSLQCLGLFFFEFIPRDIGRASSDFILSVGWLAGFLFLLFHAVQTMAWGEDRRTIHVLLARPVSRAQYVLGMFFGLAILLLLFDVVMAVIGFIILYTIKSSVADLYFNHLSAAGYLFAWLGMYCIKLIILSVTVAFSGLIRGSFPVMLMTLSYYLICSGLPVVRTVFASDDSELASIQKLLKALTFIFPDFGRYDLKHFTFDEKSLVGMQHLLADGFLTVFYIAVVLGGAAIIYQHRDLK